MSWLEKITKELSRVFPSSNITVESSEAEVVDALQQLGPLETDLHDEEVLNKLTAMQNNFSELQNSLVTTQETLSRFTESINAKFNELDTKFANVNSLEALKEEIGKEIATIKTAGTASLSADSGITTPIKATKESDGNSSIKIEMGQLFTKEIVPGLGL